MLGIVRFATFAPAMSVAASAYAAEAIAIDDEGGQHHEDVGSHGRFGLGWSMALRAAQTMSLKEFGSNCRVVVSERE